MSMLQRQMPDFNENVGMPGIIQTDGGRVNRRAAQFIYGGESVPLDDMLSCLLQSRIDTVKKWSSVQAGLLIAGIFLLTLLKATEIGTWYAFAFEAVILVIGVAIWYKLNQRTQSKTVTAAENRQVCCYRYHVLEKVFYRTDYDDTRPDCYLNLGGFFVKVPDETRYTETITGAVVTVDGEDYFYLLI